MWGFAAAASYSLYPLTQANPWKNPRSLFFRTKDGGEEAKSKPNATFWSAGCGVSYFYLRSSRPEPHIRGLHNCCLDYVV